ncbi:tetratricopeptide repeat protein [Sphingomonas sp. JC676]|uniref:tetratricopeptide repeat protein n=1 Tax=Sphingomonas sp. JC676 TaxID=2768065 RepID=UPI0016579ECB|nr:tetratricopeptide repeat protein [Sphingomonas sp. JC676]MBC9033628.1 tetratricopeptide repeat protein [Sphingomonas sp. JC676]
MALPPSGTTDEAFLREVDEEYRRDQMLSIWQRYGRVIIGVVVVGLLALAGWLYYQNHTAGMAGKRGEEYDAALQFLQQNQPAQALPALDKVAGGNSDGYAALARISEGNLMLDRNDAKGAVAKFAAVVNDQSVGQPYRDLALIRQTAAEFDALKPEVVIQRLGTLANPDSPWFGTAGEMVAAAYLKAGNRAAAGKLFAQIAQGGASVPESIRQRAVQLAGVLGVDAAAQSKEAKVQ